MRENEELEEVNDNHILFFVVILCCHKSLNKIGGTSIMRDLHTLKGKTIGVVYSYEGEDAPGFSHYHYWKSDIISKWITAIQQIKCIPYILDVRTFVEKSIAGTLPTLDFVLNLNCGGCELSTMSLIPSICCFFHIPCIPCDAVAILAGENKRISNLAAIATGLQVPKSLLPNQTNGIFRPLNLGSSIGIKKGPLVGNEPDGLYQEFIQGYDITTPIVYNPYIDEMDFMPTVIYIPAEADSNWFLGEKFKETRSGFKREAIFSLSDKLKITYLALTKNLSINTFCRIDARIKCESEQHLMEILKHPLELEDIYFIELNPMPTVWINNAFSYSFSMIKKNHTLYPYIDQLTNIIDEECNVHQFLLSLSMLSFYNHVQK